MDVNITEEQLKELSVYLTKLNNGEYRYFIKEGRFSTEETDEAFPAMRELLAFGHQIEGSPSKVNGTNYDYMYTITNGNLIQLRQMALSNHNLFESLVEKYKAALTNSNKDSLFKLKISDMTGYEFEEFLKQVGLVNK